MNPLQEIANAIASAEGFGKTGAIPTRANNPGDLALGNIGYGTMGNNITIFPSASAGNDALLNQLTKIQTNKSSVYNSDMTISEIGNLWSNGDSNWSKNVATSLGTSTDSTFSSLLKNPGDFLGGVLDGAKMALGDTNPVAGVAVQNLGTGSLLDISKWVSILLGLILIGAGVMAFKQTSVIITQGAKIAAKGAELAA